MISKFSLQNLTTKKQITIGQDIDCDYLFESGGVDWGSASATHNTYEYPNQVGCSISNTKIGTRDIQVEGYAYYIPSEDEKIGLTYQEIVDFCYSKIKMKKEILNELINPMDYVKIYINEYYIEGKPNASIIYGKTYEENNVYFCKFYFSILCNNPMFKKMIPSQTAIESITPLFRFPLTLKHEGIMFGIRKNFLSLDVENEGGVSVGGKIIIEAKTDVVNPTVIKQKTGEKIVINKTFLQGEKVIINTNDGKDRGVVGVYNGVERSYLEYWDFGNTWFKFDVGVTTISYTSRDDQGASLDVSVEINPEKYSLEEM